MRVFTPAEVARNTQSKYLGVLVAAKYTRELNALPRETLPLGEEKKRHMASPQKGEGEAPLRAPRHTIIDHHLIAKP